MQTQLNVCALSQSLANLHIPKIYLNEVPLRFVTSCKYLGVVISNGMRDDDDIMRHVRSLYTRGNMLISRFKTCSHEVKVKLFKSFLSNVYGCHLWTKYKQCTFKLVVVAYNNIYTKLFGIKRGESMSAIYVQNSINL